MNRFFGLVLLCSLSSVSLTLAADPVSLVGHNLDGWKFKGDVKKSKWKIGIAKLNKFHPDDLNAGHLEPKEPPELVNTNPKGIDAYTDFQHGDCHLSLEFMVPKGSNSGVYLMGNTNFKFLTALARRRSGPGMRAESMVIVPLRKTPHWHPGYGKRLKSTLSLPSLKGPKRFPMPGLSRCF